MDTLNKILLVEDDENDIELTLNAFDEYHLLNGVDVVRDGVEAIDYLTYNGTHADRITGNPIIIFLDIKMPKMDGQEVLKMIKSKPDLKDIPVVMLTSSGLDKDIIESYSAGVNAYVIKPIQFTEFIESIKNIGLSISINKK